jgi:hypothetical protein
MVRRWSYIDNSVDKSFLTNLSSSHKFKIFRKNTKFKRFNRGVIDFVRRKNVKRKKSFNFIHLSYVSSSWSKQYLNSKSLHRFSQGLNLFECSFQSLNPKLSLKLASKFNFTSGFQIFSIPSQRCSLLTNQFSVFNLSSSASNYSRNSIISTLSLERDAIDRSKIGVSLMIDSNLKAHLTNKYSLNANTIPLKLLLDKPAINFVISIRKIITLLALLNLRSK